MRLPFLIFLPALLLIIPGKGHGQTPVGTLIRNAFGPQVEPAGDPKAATLTGDFNGDGFQDIAVLVKPKGKRSDLLPGVKVIATAPGSKGATPAATLGGADSLALIQGTIEGWQSPKATDKFLILGFGWVGWNGPQTGKLLVLPQAKQKAGADGYVNITAENPVRLPKDIKGDAIVVPTEAGLNTTLYWNGKTYGFYFDPEDTP